MINGATVKTIRKHESFGEIALFQDDCKRTATVIAKTDAVLLSLSRDDYQAVLKQTKKGRRLSMAMDSRAESLLLQDRVRRKKSGTTLLGGDAAGGKPPGRRKRRGSVAVSSRGGSKRKKKKSKKKKSKVKVGEGGEDGGGTSGPSGVCSSCGQLSTDEVYCSHCNSLMF